MALPIVPARPQPRPGGLRFCGEACRDGYLTDVDYGLAVSPRRARANGYRNTSGCCDYCAHPVPTNAERRAVAA